MASLIDHQPISKDEFKKSMERILAFYAIPKTPEEAEQMANYMGALLEAIGSWPAYEFEEVCQYLVKRINPLKKPMVRDFDTIRDILSLERQSKRIDYCKTCKDTRFIYIQVKHRIHGEIFDAVKRCPHCNHGKKDRTKEELDVMKSIEFTLELLQLRLKSPLAPEFQAALDKFKESNK